MSQQIREQLKKEGIEVIFRKARPLNSSGSGYEELRSESVVIPKGTLFSDSGIPLPCDIIYDSDVPVKLRDGTTIYTDIYRPASEDKVPSIVAWSHYGKKVSNKTRRIGGGTVMLGLNAIKCSGLEKFEGPDPAYWCNHGYAVISPDIRGTNNSDGDVLFYGTQEGEDGYDLIEWTAAQNWSNGKVGMAGNSWLAIMQWFIAAQRPPHLTAFAPWEGFTDFYRDSLAEGGISEIPFYEFLVADVVGKNRVEDVIAMIEKYPLMNSYWEDKRAKFDRIQIPAYVTASWTNFLHSPGTLNGFRLISSKDKWLRVHNTLEWPDQYSPENEEDLRRFYDHYLKGIDNGWEKTPRVRLSILDPGGTDEVNRPENEFPLARTQYQKLFLDANDGKLSYNPISKESTVNYKAKEGKTSFSVQLDKDLEMTGYAKLHLWVEAVGSNDMDLFALMQKLDGNGRRLGHNPLSPYMPSNVLSWPRFYFYSGPGGRLRVSHRKLDPSLSTESEPYLAHNAEEFLSPGQIIPIDIPIRPFSIRWRAGEQLRLSVAGHDLMFPAFHGMPSPPTHNNGDHVIHTGGKYDSYLLVPMIL